MLKKIFKGILFGVMGLVVLFFGLVVFTLFTTTTEYTKEKPTQTKQTKWEFLQKDTEYLLKTHVLSNTGHEYAFCLICIKLPEEKQTDDVFPAIVSFQKKFRSGNPIAELIDPLAQALKGKMIILYEYPNSNTNELEQSLFVAKDEYVLENDSQVFMGENKEEILNFVNNDFVIFKMRSVEEPEDKTEIIRIVFDRSFNEAINKYFRPNGCYIRYLRER